jgi:flagellar hook-length control protein FliK
MPPAMQNLFGISTSPAPARKAAVPSKPSPSSRFESILDDARPKQAASDPNPDPVKLKTADKPADGKKAAKEVKDAGQSRVKRQSRRTAHGKDSQNAESTPEQTETSPASEKPTPDSTEEDPKQKADEHAGHAKVEEPPQAVVAPVPVVVTQTPPSAPVKPAASDGDTQKAGVEAQKKGPDSPTRGIVRPLQVDAANKPAAAAKDGKAEGAKPGEPVPPQASAETPVDPAAIAQAAPAPALLSDSPVAPRAAKEGAQVVTAADPTAALAANAVANLGTDADDFLAPIGTAGDAGPAPAGGTDADRSAVRAFSDLLASAQGVDGSPTKADGQAAHVVATQQPTAPREAQFADANHPQIVSGVHGQLLPNGGSMQLRLDPPELGALHVTVQMRDGAMTASFETSNDQATRLLTHSLGQLKTALESQGVSVEKLHVEQSPRDQKSNGEGRQPQDQSPTDHPAQQEQQRREMLRRMWRRLSGGQDPLDLVA